MNCLECREQLQKRMDGEQVALQAVEQHLRQCPACREQHTGAQRVLNTLRQLSTPKPSAHFATTMVAQVLRDRRHRHQRVRRRVFVTMALAASVVTTLMVAYYWLPRPPDGGPQPIPELVQDHPKKETPPHQAVDHLQALPEREPRSAFTALTDRVADQTRDHAKVVLAAADLDAMDRLPAVNDLPVNPGMLAAGKDVTDGVRTVTRNARKAFDFFARELPMPEMGDQKN